ncbi:hypothetical protein GF312_04080 [Candidatus Poribacteria bacterium]|nr:hypothetical protein [Candidatus Poribacteria bacterium]
MKISVFACLFAFVIMLFAMPVFAQNLKEGLVAYWMFNEVNGDTAVDSSGNGHDGALMGDPQWVEGHFGGALEFDGVEDEVNVPYHEDLNPEEFTACLWANVEPGSAGNHRAAISCRDDFPREVILFMLNRRIHGNTGSVLGQVE